MEVYCGLFTEYVVDSYGNVLWIVEEIYCGLLKEFVVDS